MPHIPQPGDPDFDWSQYDRYKRTAPDPVQAAKDFLAQAPDLSHVADLEDRASALTGPKHGLRESLRDITEPMATVGGGALLGSLIPGPQSPVLGGAGIMMTSPDALRRMLVPVEGESRLGGLAEAGLNMLPALKGLRSARQLASVEEGAAPMIQGVVEYAKERAGQLQQGTGLLARKAAMKRASQEAGWPLSTKAPVSWDTGRGPYEGPTSARALAALKALTGQ
jgi:hypothetical protein